jgi:hypothetical protein
MLSGVFHLAQPRLIVTAGLTCAGKSTITSMLFLILRGRNIKTRKVRLDGLWGLVGYSRLFVSFARTLFSGLDAATVLIGARQPRFRLSSWLVGLWCMLDTFAMYAEFIVKIRVPLRLGYFVIADLGGWLSWLANYSRMNSLFPATSPWIGLMQMLLRSAQPSRALFLDARTSVLEARWRDRGDIVHVATAASFADMCDSLRPWILKLMIANYREVVRLDTSQEKITVKRLYETVHDLLNRDAESK